MDRQGLLLYRYRRSSPRRARRSGGHEAMLLGLAIADALGTTEADDGRLLDLIAEARRRWN